MELPLLKVLQGGAGRELTTCRGKDYCADCTLHVSKGGRCEGCTIRKKTTALTDNFAACYQECSTCTGYKVLVPAICCRSPMKKLYLDSITRNPGDWNNPKLEFHERPPITTHKQRAVFYITSGGVNTIGNVTEPLVEHELVATNLSRVWSGNGFYARNLKQILRLPQTTKLLLLTMTKDDLLESAWRCYFYADPAEYERVKIDYWMPLSFSSYPVEAHMHQIYQLYRTLYCTEQSRAWFTTGDHFQEGLRIDDLFIKCVTRIQNVVFNTQFVSDETYKFHLRLFQHAHEISPIHVPFWFVGRADPTFMHNVKKVCGRGSRVLFWVSSKPLYAASKGLRLDLKGKPKPSMLPKVDLVRENYAVFERMVNDYGR